jgi:hypothetical protein
MELLVVAVVVEQSMVLAVPEVLQLKLFPLMQLLNMDLLAEIAQPVADMLQVLVEVAQVVQVVQ